MLSYNNQHENRIKEYYEGFSQDVAILNFQEFSENIDNTLQSIEDFDNMTNFETISKLFKTIAERVVIYPQKSDIYRKDGYPLSRYQGEKNIYDRATSLLNVNDFLNDIKKASDYYHTEIFQKNYSKVSIYEIMKVHTLDILEYHLSNLKESLEAIKYPEISKEKDFYNLEYKGKLAFFYYREQVNTLNNIFSSTRFNIYNDILNKAFSLNTDFNIGNKSVNGYKQEDIKEFIDKVSNSFPILSKNKNHILDDITTKNLSEKLIKALGNLKEEEPKNNQPGN